MQLRGGVPVQTELPVSEARANAHAAAESSDAHTGSEGPCAYLTAGCDANAAAARGDPDCSSGHGGDAHAFCSDRNASVSDIRAGGTDALGFSAAIAVAANLVRNCTNQRIIEEMGASSPAEAPAKHAAAS